VECAERAEALLEMNPMPVTQLRFLLPLRIRLATDEQDAAAGAQLLAQMKAGAAAVKATAVDEAVAQCEALLAELNQALGNAREPVVFNGHLPSELPARTRLALAGMLDGKPRPVQEAMQDETAGVPAPDTDWVMPEALLARQL
jgi:hypothetical protein